MYLGDRMTFTRFKLLIVCVCSLILMYQDNVLFLCFTISSLREQDT